MMPLFIAAAHIVCALPCFSETAQEWIEKASQKIDLETLEWVKQQLQSDVDFIKLKSEQKSSRLPETKKCLTGSISEASGDIPIYVMMSFSIPDQTWVSLSNEMQKVGAVFVLQGLPKNSFKDLSRKIQHLNSLGVAAPIQINPELFSKHKIEHVPTFLIQSENRSDKISGNISLAYAIEKMGGL